MQIHILFTLDTSMSFPFIESAFSDKPIFN
ncbi:hypothetical protein AN394_02893 [Pseudoalteromonas sp. P1-26]|nr:hypothetical protein AN213_02720 [Pseudoalteromonas sp. P1-8]KPZ69048.1 hypothetical protein AN394_02893 [Pseudoalteromonas sp. P1-26]